MSAPAPAEIQPWTYSAPELAQLLGLSRSRIYEMAARNELPGMVRIGGYIKFDRETINHWWRAQVDRHLNEEYTQ